jgi:hypothetical protein
MPRSSLRSAPHECLSGDMEGQQVWKAIVDAILELLRRAQ